MKLDLNGWPNRPYDLSTKILLEFVLCVCVFSHLLLLLNTSDQLIFYATLGTKKLPGTSKIARIQKAPVMRDGKMNFNEPEYRAQFFLNAMKGLNSNWLIRFDQ